MARSLASRLPALASLSRVPPLRPLFPFLTQSTQVRRQTTDIKRGDCTIQKALGPASYVGMKSTFSSDIETCTVVPSHTSLPVYQVLDSEGRVHDPDQVSMSNEEVLDIYKQMVSTHVRLYKILVLNKFVENVVIIQPNKSVVLRWCSGLIVFNFLSTFIT